ncbi:MAG: flagellar motor protein MotB [Candidatus Eisenbacteria sp.]|nr:flagellar motor protein MotB [Candidatus Eisenbacteria bacterium]
MAKKDRPEQEDVASWLTTFGDLATLLLTFYVLIYASCTYRPGQWETTKGAIERILAVLPGRSGSSLAGGTGYGPLPGGTAVLPLLGFGKGVGSGEAGGDPFAEALEEALAVAADVRYKGRIDIEPTDRGLVFRLTEPIAFKIGEADLNPGIRDFLKPVAKMARVGRVEIVVEGYTCDLPIRTERFASNWELSGARASEVLRLLEEEGIGDARISAVAYGEHHPLVPNADAGSRKRNRRVDIQMIFSDRTEG